MGSGTTSGSQDRQSSVGKVFLSLSQVLGISSSQFDAQKIVSYQDGKFVVDNEELMGILEKGTTGDKVNALKLLKDEMVNITYEERLGLWKSVKAKINLKKEGVVRTEALKVLQELLNFSEFPKTNGMEFYIDICENINFLGIDKDMKIFLVCFHELLRFADMSSFEKYTDHPLNDFLIKLHKQILVYRTEELDILIVSLISECIGIDRHLFTSDDLQDLLNTVINMSIKTKNMLELKSFLDFFDSYLLTGYKYEEELYTIFSILGCANGLEELETSGRCETLLDRILVDDLSSKVPFTLCDIISGRYNDKQKHRNGNRPVIGCLRLLSYTLKYFDEASNSGKSITSFFEHHLNYLFQTLLTISKSTDEAVSIEVLKFIDEMLEKPFMISGYYKYFIERNEFWKLLQLLNWRDKQPISSSYKDVLNELFNKLQNFDLNSFYVSRLIEYLEENYQILSSYNISYTLNYYSTNLVCVCGALNWKQKCETIVEKYYSTAPSEVLNVLKDSFLYCIPLKIDQPSLDFYINILCYVCILGLRFKLNDDVLEPLTDVILKLDDQMLEKVVDDYTMEIQSFTDLNKEVITKTLLLATLKFADNKKTSGRTFILLNSVVKVAKFSAIHTGLKLFNLAILLLTRIRACKDASKSRLYIYEIKSEDFRNEYFLSRNENSENDNDNKDIDQKIKQIFDEQLSDPRFERRMSEYFFDGKTKEFETEINPNVLLGLYIDILGNTTSWELYFIVVKHIRHQLLNYDLFGETCDESIIELTKLLTQQMQFIYAFKFERPHWLQTKHIRIAIVEVLYGIYPYKEVIPLRQGEDLLRSVALDFHFFDIIRTPFLNYLHCCMFEFPNLMKHFVFPILKMIQDDLSKPETLFTSLGFILDLYELSGCYELSEKEVKLVHDVLKRVLNYRIGEYDSNYKEIKRSKILAGLIFETFGPAGGDGSVGPVVVFKTAIRFTHLVGGKAGKEDDLFARVAQCCHEKGSLAGSVIDLGKIKVSAALCGVGADLYNYISAEGDEIEVVLVEQELNSELVDESMGKKIVITTVDENRDYFTVSSYGFEYIKVGIVFVGRRNIVQFVKVLIELCSVSVSSSTE